jgi:hypothetical protein
LTHNTEQRRPIVRIRIVVAGLISAGLLAGCASVVDGAGSSGARASGGGSSNKPDFPSQSAPPSGSGGSSAPSGGSSGTVPSTVPSGSTSSGVNPPGTRFSCPDIAYPYAHLAFTCLTPTLQTETDNKVWPLALSQTVEPASGWVVEEGAGHWGSAGAQTLAEITVDVRGRMVDNNGYGTSPTVTTTSSADTTVGGVKAHVLQTTFTLNPAWAAQNKTKVKVERSWIVALQVGSDDVSLWYTSIPDLVQQYWAAVPKQIAAIRVTP